MSWEQILATVRAFDDVLEVAPTESSGFPEIAWGDHFFYYSPNGRIPKRVQPYATITTKNYPDDILSDLNPPGRWRVNIHISKETFTRLLGTAPKHAVKAPQDFAEPDALLPHPVYATASWVAVVNPGARTSATIVRLLHEAHEKAQQRFTLRSNTR